MYNSNVSNYCKKCVYPIFAVNLSIDSDGICSACKSAEQFNNLDLDYWNKRKNLFEQEVERILKTAKGNYHCIIPVSGGKDSYFQIHKLVTDYSLKPLLVTYNGNNYLPEGEYNRDRMHDVFDADHLMLSPSVQLLKKMNRLCFRKMGDMNWHNHCGINTYPIQVAVKFQINTLFWGEPAWDISGMFDPDDFIEFSARIRLEHNLRGFDWHDMLNDPIENISEHDLAWAKYPSDQEIIDNDTRGIYIGNYFKWDPNYHTNLVKNEYGWKESDIGFQRTYRKMSNLDDRYENGVHDLLKFIKFGYGRASDHASKDIRSGYLSREKGIELVKHFDHVVSDDLYHWLEYVNMTQEEFWAIADSFRDPNVWWIENGLWFKNNIWGEPSSYGTHNLPEIQASKYLRH
jgi:N-acetyl sugar amidotransferase